jgi:hypothetical protein
MKGTILTMVVLLGLLTAATAVGVWAWRELGEVSIGMHGMIALVLGAGLTLLLGMGLMWLVYYSHKRGYDDRVGKDY